MNGHRHTCVSQVPVSPARPPRCVLAKRDFPALLDRASAEVRTQVRKKVRTETGRCNRGCNGLGPVITVRRLTRRLPAERWLPAMRLPRWLTAKVQVRKAEVRKEVRTENLIKPQFAALDTPASLVTEKPYKTCIAGLPKVPLMQAKHPAKRTAGFSQWRMALTWWRCLYAGARPGRDQWAGPMASTNWTPSQALLKP